MPDKKEKPSQGAVRTQYKNNYMSENYDQVRFIVKKGEKDIIRKYADKHGVSLNSYITRAVIEMMARDDKEDEEHTEE